MKQYISPQVNTVIFQKADLMTGSVGRDWAMDGPFAPDQDWQIGEEAQAAEFF